MSVILGVNPGLVLGHDPSAAVVVNGKLMAAAEEERFVRIKHGVGKMPLNAIKYCLRECNLEASDVDHVAISWDANNVWRPFLFQIFNKATSLSNVFTNAMREPGMLPPIYKKRIIQWLGTILGNVPPVSYIEHHLAHAAGGFFCSGFRKATIVTVDGAGENNSTVIWTGEGKTIQKMDEVSNKNSLGFFYATITDFLGFRPFDGEGKTMGLAAYGKHDSRIDKKMKSVIDPERGKWYRTDPSTVSDVSHLLGYPQRRRKISPLEQPYRNIAWAAQEALERSLLRVVRDAVSRSESSNLVLAGGVTLNCKANQRILDSGIAHNIFIFPVAGDGGTAEGAALALSAELNEVSSFRMEHPYYGPRYADDSIHKILDERKLSYEYHKDMGKVVGELISDGLIVGWFRGRMECGPRALGNRSILADPRDSSMKDIVNLHVKRREQWRPYAPSMLEERAERYLVNTKESPFMILSSRVHSERANEISSVVHVDGTTRPHTVKREVNPEYWEVIKTFERETSVPAILNTSFNIAGDPIVCAPQDALQTFFNCGMDCLALENFLIRKPSSSA